jgi:putative transposase
MNSTINQRKSYIEIGELYFWSATIKDWNHLLTEEEYKQILVDSFAYLKGKLDVFAFVIMPNHVHAIIRINEHNGKEKPHTSWLKFTAHAFNKKLKNTPVELEKYKVDKSNKEYQFWQADSLAIHLFNKEVAYQKLDYIHLNPLQGQGHWTLAKRPEDYRFSSAAFYELDRGDFNFIKDLREEF